MQFLFKNFGHTRKEIADSILEFVGLDKHPQFYAYYGAYDWVCFCQLFGRMIDLPEGYPMLQIVLKQMMIERGLSNEWKQKNCPDPKNEHSAIEDARWDKKLYEKMIKYKIK